MPSLTGPETSLESVADYLDRNHYLGRATRGFAYEDEHGIAVLAKPTSRRLPSDGTWLELIRWCLSGERNAGSRQWSAIVRWLRANMPQVTTVVSYSDPSVGHTGALYKASNWRWAPTWHRLRPPPSGHGSWSSGRTESVKDRWVYPISRDPRRADLLAIRDAAVLRRFPEAEYRER